MCALKAYWKSAGQLDGLAYLLVLAACACGGSTSAPSSAEHVVSESRVQHRRHPERPGLTLVEREGDPQSGLALAVRVGDEASAALGLAMLVEERLRAAGLESVVSQASPSGFITYALAKSKEAVWRFVDAGSSALLASPSPDEGIRVAARVNSASVRSSASPSEGALARCSGELMVNRGERVQVVGNELSSWLEGISPSDVAFAVVGPSSALGAAEASVRALPAWPRTTSRVLATSVLEDVFGVSPGIPGVLGLSVAVSNIAPRRAIAAAERLADSDALLAVRLGAAFPSWQVGRVASNIGGFGACLRVDLQSKGVGPAAPGAVARSASHALSEIEQTLSSLEPGSWVLAKQVLAMEGPHQAAAVAAWQALHTEVQRPAKAQRIVHFAGELAPGLPEHEFAELMAESAVAPDAVERRRGVELGQGKFWMLLATPCGTSTENAATAGTLSLALHATASAFNGRDGVSLEPWLSVDAMGIIAHADVRDSEEAPADQARRVAEALARALLSSGPPPELVAQSREALMTGLGDGPTPALSLALRQISGNHPSWLEPRGTWATLSAISARTAQLERESFLRGKLRLATLGNHDIEQVQSAEGRLLELLSSAEAGSGECPARALPSAVPGRYRIEAVGRSDAEALLAIPLPTEEAGLSPESLWTEILMNRAGGWLSQALHRPGLVSTARARVLGGSGAAALLIEVHAIEGKRDEAVAQVRGLLARLRAGAATAADVRTASEYLERREAQRQLDPRGRLIDVWSGERRRGGDLASLRALHRAAFEAGREVVILADPSE